MVTTWEHLTTVPNTAVPGRCYRLRGDYATATVDGKIREQWQYKPTLREDLRIWYVVVRDNDRTSGGRGVPHQGIDASPERDEIGGSASATTVPAVRSCSARPSPSATEANVAAMRP